jgi:hypothetical protein
VIPNTACLNGVIHYSNFNGIDHLVHRDVINFDVFLTDDERQEIDFQGCPVYLTFNIKTIREVVKPPSFQEMYKNANEDLAQMNALKSLEPQKIVLKKN